MKHKTIIHWNELAVLAGATLCVALMWAGIAWALSMPPALSSLYGALIGWCSYYGFALLFGFDMFHHEVEWIDKETKPSGTVRLKRRGGWESMK